jgi:hypothetical protein
MGAATDASAENAGGLARTLARDGREAAGGVGATVEAWVLGGRSDGEAFVLTSCEAGTCVASASAAAAGVDRADDTFAEGWVVGRRVDVIVIPLMI